MPFDMHGDVILTRDVPEHGARASDIGTGVGISYGPRRVPGVRVTFGVII